MKINLISQLFNPGIPYFISKRIRSLFFMDQWIILAAANTKANSPAWVDFIPIIPPPDRDWADPFVIVRDGKYFIFLEEKLYATNRGRIVCLTLNRELEIQAAQVVLERQYHLSYPFLLEHNKQLYMIPESAENHQIELYRCVRFPDQWEFEKVLIKNVDAVDSTLIDHNGMWWLFANVIMPEGSSWDTLNLYFSDDPLSSEWTPHPRNPIVKNIRSARPAGRIIVDHGGLVRPSQDCSVRYGYAINFNRITKLTKSDYKETSEQSFKPPQKGGIIATHTWNQTNDLVTIDAVYRRRRTSTTSSDLVTIIKIKGA
jgi:hypothetical protein